MTMPTIIEQPTTATVEATRAKLWRKNVARMSVNELSAATGYSRASIQVFERGYRPDGKTLSARTWRRYRLVCAGLGSPDFQWGHHDAV